jgi:hypothetical protein
LVNALVHATLGKTELFVEGLVSAGVKREDITVVVTQQREYKRAQRIVDQAQIKLLAKAPKGWESVYEGNAPTKALLESLKSCGFSLSDLVLSDRVLRRHRADLAVAWLNNYVYQLDEIIIQNDIHLAIGETANSSEIVLLGSMRKLHRHFVEPGTLRIPDNRFALWIGPQLTDMWEREKFNDEFDSAQYLKDWLSSPLKPFYFEVNDEKPSSEILDISKSLLTTLKLMLKRDGFEMQIPRVIDYFRLPWINRFRLIRNTRKTDQIEWDMLQSDTEYVLYPLHVQPESSIDWFGDAWRNQLNTIRVVAHELSSIGIILAVKDHSNFIWNRGIKFFEILRSIDNVVLLNPDVNITDVSNNAVLTITVSGTIGLENALRGVNTGIVANQEWAELDHIARIDNPGDVVKLIFEKKKADPESIERWFKSYLGNSWSGLIADKDAYPNVLTTVNIGNLGIALSEFISKEIPNAN